MKKIKFLALMLIAGTMMFSSCGNDEDPEGPTLSVNALQTEAWLNDTLQFVYTVSSNEKLVKLTMTANSNDVDAQEITLDGNSATDTITVILPGTGLTEGSIDFTFDAEDKDGAEWGAAKTVTITIKKAASDINTFTAILLGAQDNATKGSYLDAETGDVYLTSAASTNQALIDIVYYYGDNNLATLTAPNDATVGGGTGNFFLCEGWDTKNATVFNSTTGITWTDVTDDSEIVTAAKDAALTKVTQLTANDIVAFETVDGKKGLFMVKSISGEATGSITIEVKIQE